MIYIVHNKKLGQLMSLINIIVYFLMNIGYIFISNNERKSIHVQVNRNVHNTKCSMVPTIVYTYIFFILFEIG